MTDENQRTRVQLRISQEMIAIVTVGVALAGLMLVTTGDLREEARADRAAWQAQSQQLRNEWQAQSQQLRNEWQAESRQLRDEARADREAAQRDREAFQREGEAFRREGEAFRREILRLTQGQAELAAIVASTRPKNE